jgi:hypothetical protein
MITPITVRSLPDNGLRLIDKMSRWRSNFKADIWTLNFHVLRRSGIACRIIA